MPSPPSSGLTSSGRPSWPRRPTRGSPTDPKPGAGMRHAVSTWGKGRGVARVQRLTQGAKGAESPNNVGGRRAFPPKAEKDWSKKINRKERTLAKLVRAGRIADVGDGQEARTPVRRGGHPANRRRGRLSRR